MPLGADADKAEAQFRTLAAVSDGELGSMQSVKFYIKDLQTAPEVYFQNTRLHPVHYDFVRDVLGLPRSPHEITALSIAAERAISHFAPLYETSVAELTLDIEFKFVGDTHALILKQARPFASLRR